MSSFLGSSAALLPSPYLAQVFSWHSLCWNNANKCVMREVFQVRPVGLARCSRIQRAPRELLRSYRKDRFPAAVLWETLLEDISETWEPCRLMGLNEPNIIRRSNLQRWADTNILIPQSQKHTFHEVFNELISTNKSVLLKTPETSFFFLKRIYF